MFMQMMSRLLCCFCVCRTNTVNTDSLEESNVKLKYIRTALAGECSVISLLLLLLLLLLRASGRI